MRNIKRLIGITAILVLGLMALGATVVLAAPLAQDEDPELVEPETDTPEGETEEQTSPCNISPELLEQVIDHDALEAIQAEALGMTVEELRAAKDSGQRLEEIAEAQNVDPETVKTAVAEAKAEMVQQALDDGLITEQQAECILSHHGRCHGGRGHGGSPNGGEAAPATNNAAFNA